MLSLTVLSFNFLRFKKGDINPMREGNMSKLKVGIVYYNLEDSFWLKAYVPLRCESIVATPDPTLSLTLLGTSKG